MRSFSTEMVSSSRSTSYHSNFCFRSRLFLERIDDYVAEDSPVRVVDVFIDDLDVSDPGFRTEPNATGRPSYHPKMMLKLYVYGYGYLNRVPSSRCAASSAC